MVRRVDDLTGKASRAGKHLRFIHRPSNERTITLGDVDSLPRSSAILVVGLIRHHEMQEKTSLTIPCVGACSRQTSPRSYIPVIRLAALACLPL